MGLEPTTFRLGRSHTQRHPIWVGYESGSPQTVTGYLSFEPFLNGRPGYDVTSDLAIYLHPDHCGRGQGRHLPREAIEHAPTLGVRTLATTIFARNEPSIRLFRSHGFQEWGRLPGVADLEGVIHDIVVVGRLVVHSAMNDRTFKENRTAPARGTAEHPYFDLCPKGQ